MNLSDITETVFQSIPHTIIPTEQDTKLLRKHKKLLLSYGNDLAKGLYHDDNLQEKTSPEVRKQREQRLHKWYQISITCDFDQHYWNWQVFVGVEHVKHNVSNASVLTMWVWIMTSMQQNLLRDLETSEALKVLSVFQKLQAVVTSLVVEGNISTQKEGIYLASGLNNNILTRLVGIEINQLIMQGKKELMLSDSQEKKAA
jgi:hypothetical protein